MQIMIGTVNADPRTLDKSGMMTNTRPIDVQIWKNCDIKKPTFLLDVRAENVHANYCYVQEWNAYYFLSEPVVMDGVRCTVTGTLDYLTTYAGGIKNLTGYLIRTADNTHVNKYLPDPHLPKQKNRMCRTYDFDRSPFTANYASDVVYILTVIGGGVTPT